MQDAPSPTARFVRASLDLLLAYLAFLIAWDFVLADALGFSDLRIGDAYVPILADGFFPVFVGQAAAFGAAQVMASDRPLTGSRAIVTWLVGLTVTVALVASTAFVSNAGWTQTVELRAPMPVVSSDFEETLVLPKGTRVAVRALPAPPEGEVALRESRLWWDAGPRRSFVGKQPELLRAVLGTKDPTLPPPPSRR